MFELRDGDVLVVLAILIYFIVVLTIGFVYAKRSNSSESESFGGFRLSFGGRVSERTTLSRSGSARRTARVVSTPTVLASVSPAIVAGTSISAQKFFTICKYTKKFLNPSLSRFSVPPAFETQQKICEGRGDWLNL